MVRNLMVVLIVAVVGAVLAAPGLAAEPDITGKDKCEGTFGGKAYSGTVEITKSGDSYQITWNIGGTATDTFVGILDGDVFAANYEGSNTGVILYTIEKGGDKVTCKWVRNEGKGLLHTETLTKMK
jgi:hypothetical protein